jgi:hypothetical protein
MECSADGGLEEGSHVAGGLELWVSCWSASGWSLWGGYRGGRWGASRLIYNSIYPHHSKKEWRERIVAVVAISLVGHFSTPLVL